MTSPSISVALCTFNRDHYLQQQLDSIAAQTLLPGELVVCDDGSTDNALEILKNFQKTAPFPVRIIRNEQNLGIAKNFEKCISLCTGDFIALCDSDDEWYPQKLEVLRATLRSHPSAAYAVADADLIDELNRPIMGSCYDKCAFRLTRKPKLPFDIREETLIRGNVVWGSSMMMRAETQNLIFPLPSGFKDYAIALLSCFAGSHGIAIADRLMRYRLHPAQACGALPPIWKVTKLIPALRATQQYFWAKEIQFFRELKDHVYSKPEMRTRSSPAILQLLDRKIAHLERRELARSSAFLKRWRISTGELAAGNYHQLSYSWYSFVRDVFL